MELWIRSQDKRTLINTKRIDVDDTNIIVWDEGRYASEIYLGKYKTKERALEVLNEIQELLMPKIVFKDEGRDYITPQGQIYKLNIKQPINTDMQELSSYVYEMPKD